MDRESKMSTVESGQKKGDVKVGERRRVHNKTSFETTSILKLYLGIIHAKNS